MRTYDNTQEPEKIGLCFLFYAITGAGKSRSIGTANGVIYAVNTQKKDLRNVLLGCPKQIHIFKFDNWDEEMTYVNSWVQAARDGKFPAQNVFVDDLTYAQQEVNQELEDNRYEVRMEDDRKDKQPRGIIDRATLEVEDFGAGNKLVLRLIKLYTTLAEFGVNVFFTAIEGREQIRKRTGPRTVVSEDGKIWPSVTGKQIPNALHGLFDYIGYINKPFKYVVNESGDKFPEPAMITFAPGYHEFGLEYVSRCSSDKLLRMGPVTLHWTKILEIIKEEQRELWAKARGVNSKKEGGENL